MAYTLFVDLSRKFLEEILIKAEVDAGTFVNHQWCGFFVEQERQNFSESDSNLLLLAVDLDIDKSSFIKVIRRSRLLEHQLDILETSDLQFAAIESQTFKHRRRGQVIVEQVI